MEKCQDRPNSSTATGVHVPGEVGKVDPRPGTPINERRGNNGKVSPHTNFSVLNKKAERKYTVKDHKINEKRCGLAKFSHGHLNDKTREGGSKGEQVGPDTDTLELLVLNPPECLPGPQNLISTQKVNKDKPRGHHHGDTGG